MSFQIAHNGVSTGRAYEYGGIFPLFGLLAGAAKLFLPTIAATVVPAIGQAITGRVMAAIAPQPAAERLTTDELDGFDEFEFEDEDEFDALLAELEELEMGPASFAKLEAPARSMMFAPASKFTTAITSLRGRELL